MSMQQHSIHPSAKQKSSTLFPHIEFKHVMIWPFMLPFISIGGSIILSIILHFKDVTATHCKVDNWLPTISAAVGNNAPEKYLFRFGIGNYTSLKIIYDVTVFIMLQSLREHKQKVYHKLPYSKSSFNFWNRLALVLAIIEDISLCLLTMISSTDDKAIHILAFATFMLTAHFHFVASLMNNKCARSPFSDDERRWYRYRIICAVIHTSVMSFACYLYWRHNEFCEPGIYSLFALCEYTVVFFNICFHAVGWLEWGHLKYAIRDHNLVGKEE